MFNLAVIQQVGSDAFYRINGDGKILSLERPE
jgi:hypothetical protein